MLPPWEWPKVKNQNQIAVKKDNLDTAKFCYNVNRIWITIQRDVYFILGNMQRKYNKRNSWTEVSDETIPKPKIRKGIKWFLKCSHSFVPAPISEQEGLNFRKMGKGATNFGGHFLILSCHCNWHCFCILVEEIFL